MKYGIETKGQLNGKCNRMACLNGPAIWWSVRVQAYYCEECAIEINKWILDGVSKIHKVEQNA